MGALVVREDGVYSQNLRYDVDVGICSLALTV